VDLGRVIAALAPTEVVGRGEAEIRDLAYDARRAGPGSLFFCVPGARADGHDFAAEAVANGAVALVVERPLDPAVPQLVVPDARSAMAIVADEFFGRPTERLVVVGVTGTSGKTTTTFLLHSILQAAGLAPGLLGTVETRVGGERRPAVRTTAEAIDLQRAFRRMLDDGNRSVALEATSHGSKLRRLDCVRFAALVFTNLSQDHLDFHGTMEAYFDAKRRLFVETRPPAAVNIDDGNGRRLADELRALGHERLITFGFAEDADLRPERVTVDRNGGGLSVGGLELRFPLLGRFNVENVLGAVAAAQLLGLAPQAVAEGVASVEEVPGRFERVDEGQPFTVVVDYAHKPGSLERVLAAARELVDGGRVICVFGCGGDRDRGKRPLMGRIAAGLSDSAIVTSDNPRSEDPEAIIEEIVDGAADLEVEPDRREAIGRALEAARPGDVVVIAGKGHEQGQELRDRTIPFDDREVAREALRRLGATA
jgi:UDP-N-acetylmuramoyl-L-alanyl-D-glutamate--2,6-diaminopimelate ligase